MIIINADNKVNITQVEQEHLAYFKQTLEDELDHYMTSAKSPYKKVYSYLKDHIDDILIGQPNALKGIIEHVTTQLKLALGKKSKTPTLDKNLRAIFNYKSKFVGSYPPKKWGAYQFVTMLNVKVCPYCNRQYIFTICEESGKTRGKLDHFYDKATYPYLALSMYNLIPCCSICNSDLKGSEAFTIDTHLNPYIEDFGGLFKFSVAMKSGDELRPGDTSGIDYLLGVGDEFDIVIKDSCLDLQLKQRVENNLEIFKLRELYNMHKDYVVDLIKKRVIYSDTQIDELFKKYGGKLFSSREDVIATIISNYATDQNLDKRVLSKLAKDISDELNLNLV
ncbi:hypothetical protein PAECIP111893_01400 [Paenibacillus plantiphilus]|uniref:HNH endonuclease n=1 Tax=Paenibacillus plantiphilus TaxID=2905650 RepID=A0ABN8GAP7_9BACL|nr:hypothetical protein [Paenibacillus plantiphilus]CAH1200501.1 hypothetical protein PAECIP111893_01400 [Paenibacillus plantiphilus]